MPALRSMDAIEVLAAAKTLGGNGGVAVLRGVTLRVPRGQWLGLRGATGAGKTTLLRLIAGLDAPDRGEVRLDGRLVTGPGVHVPPAQRGIGFVFQSLGLWPHLSVAGHLDYALAASPFSSKERVARREELLSAFRLVGLASRRPAQLSGGEKHLLALARALAGDVRVLLLDEPFAGLDGELKVRVFEALLRLQSARRLSAVLVTHDPTDSARLCQAAVHLREGQLVESNEVLT